MEEAARWLAKLTGGDSSRELHAEFKRWLSADRRNTVAMDLVQATWAASGPLVRRPAPALRAEVRRKPAAARTRLGGYGLAAAAAIAAVAVFIAVDLGAPAETLSTRQGETLARDLPDGSRLTLNTATEVRVRYGLLARRIQLVRGEAVFQVAHDRRRPFVVSANRFQVKAIGTRFDVRDLGLDADVFLDEGVVELSAPGEPQRTVLKPKQSARVAASGRVVAIGTFDPESALAWRNGQIVFDRTPVAEALKEFSRYSPLSISVDPAVADVKVSGVYRTGNAEGFATAVARMHGLRVERPRPGVLALRPLS